MVSTVMSCDRTNGIMHGDVMSLQVCVSSVVSCDVIAGVCIQCGVM